MDAAKTYRCLVVDDERHAIELLSDYIHSTPRLQLVKTYQDSVDALLDRSPTETYDFAFLDIDMPRLSGLELARSLRPFTTFLVFTTAHPKYALEAFDVRADHFLLKPISMSKFAVAVDLLLKSRDITPNPSPADNTFYIKSDQKNKLIKIHLHEIISIEGLKNYVLIHTSAQRHIAYLTMKEIENALSHTNGFIRVHKSFIISKHHIERVENRSVLLKQNIEVPIGDTYRQAFFEYITGKVIVSGR